MPEVANGADIASAVAAACSAIAAFLAAAVAWLTFRFQKEEREHFVKQNREQAAVSLEQQYGTSVAPAIEHLRGLERAKGSPRNYAYAYFVANRQKPLPLNQKEALSVDRLTDLEIQQSSDAIAACRIFWNSFQSLHATNALPADIVTRLGCAWAIRAAHCLRLVEPLDVANWYVLGNHTGNGAYSTPNTTYRPSRYAFLEEMLVQAAYTPPKAIDGPVALDEPYKVVYGI
jgi:hypothetical protein